MKFFVTGPTGENLDETIRFDYKKAVSFVKAIINQYKGPKIFLVDGEPFAGHILVELADMADEIILYNLIEIKEKALNHKVDLVLFEETIKGDVLNEKHRAFRRAWGVESIARLNEIENKKKNNHILISREADIIIGFESREDYRNQYINHKNFQSLSKDDLDRYSGVPLGDEATFLKVDIDRWISLRKKNIITGNDVLSAIKIKKLMEEK